MTQLGLVLAQPLHLPRTRAALAAWDVLWADEDADPLHIEQAARALGEAFADESSDRNPDREQTARSVAYWPYGPEWVRRWVTGSSAAWREDRPNPLKARLGLSSNAQQMPVK